MISTASRVRQLIATALVAGGGVGAALYDALTWPLVVVLLGSLWSYSAKSVLQETVRVAGEYVSAKVGRK